MKTRIILLFLAVTFAGCSNNINVAEETKLIRQSETLQDVPERKPITIPSIPSLREQGDDVVMSYDDYVIVDEWMTDIRRRFMALQEAYIFQIQASNSCESRQTDLRIINLHMRKLIESAEIETRTAKIGEGVAKILGLATLGFCL